MNAPDMKRLSHTQFTGQQARERMLTWLGQMRKRGGGHLTAPLLCVKAAVPVGSHRSSATRVLRELVTLGVAVEVEGRRDRVFYVSPLLGVPEARLAEKLPELEPVEMPSSPPQRELVAQALRAAYGILTRRWATTCSVAEVAEIVQASYGVSNSVWLSPKWAHAWSLGALDPLMQYGFVQRPGGKDRPTFMPKLVALVRRFGENGIGELADEVIDLRNEVQAYKEECKTQPGGDGLLEELE